jgi:hypothetical protein
MTPFGANTTATNPVNQTRHVSPKANPRRCQTSKARVKMWLAVGVFDDFSPIPCSTKRIFE